MEILLMDPYFNYLMKSLLALVFFLIIFVGPNLHKPIFPRKCDECGKRNRDWSIHPTGHDDFSFFHNCEKNDV